MKDSLKKPYRLVLLAAFAFAAVAVIFRTILLFTSFETDVQHFTSGIASDLLFPLLLIISAAFFVFFGIVSRKEFDIHVLPPSIAVTFSSAFCTVAVLVWTVTQCTVVFSATTLLQRIFGLLMILFAIMLASYFVLCAVGSITDSLRAFACIGATLAFVFYILFYYFDMSRALNNPLKVFDQLTFLCLALFMLAECRFYFKKAHYAIYLPIAFLAMVLCAANSIPSLLFTLKTQTAAAGSIMHDFMVFAFFVYITARLFAAIGAKEPEAAPSAYAQEISKEQEKSFTPDLETHVTAERDPAQQSFDFDGSGKVEEVGAQTQNEQDSGDYDTDAQTTIDFETTKK